jgi:pimeloyl-ACP methyl ester carboxylesterase
MFQDHPGARSPVTGTGRRFSPGGGGTAQAFLVAVDREACAFYKEALDAILPPEYSEIVFTGNNSDPAHLKKWHIDEKKEKHRVIDAGHNLPQEAPAAFAEAVLPVRGWLQADQRDR